LDHMSTATQNIDSAVGLNKDALLKAEAAAAATQSAPALDPDYPWYVLAFQPDFYGVPMSITPEDL